MSGSSDLDLRLFLSWTLLDLFLLKPWLSYSPAPPWPSPSVWDGLLGLGEPLLLGLGLLDLDLERLPEPDLDGEEDITNVLLAAKEKDFKFQLIVRKIIDDAIYLKIHYTIEYSLHVDVHSAKPCMHDQPSLNSQLNILLNKNSEMSRSAIAGIPMRR